MVCVSDLLLVTVQNRNIFPVFKGEKKNLFCTELYIQAAASRAEE